MFPRRYDLLAQILLDEVSDLVTDDLERLRADETLSRLTHHTHGILLECSPSPRERRAL